MSCLPLLALLLAACLGGFADVGDTGFAIDNCFDTGSSSLMYADVDGDGFGDPDAALDRCTAPTDFVADNTDCDDADATVNPDATEVCDDRVDQDCSGTDLACEA